MQIVDAQIHLWGEGLPSNMSHWQVTSFTTAQAVALMDEAGIDAAVIHPPPWDPNANDMAIKAVQDHPGRFAIMHKVPWDEAIARPMLERWHETPGMLGIRYTFLEPEQREALESGALDWLWAACEKAGVPVSGLITDSLPALGRIAERYPGLKFTVDHLGGRGGTTTLKDDAAMTHMPDLIALAKHPNVGVKATGAPGYCSGPYPFISMHTYLQQIYDAFGPTRMFWGTDISKMPCSWTECVEMFTEHLPWLAKEDLPQIMGEAVCAWWGWDRKA